MTTSIRVPEKNKPTIKLKKMEAFFMCQTECFHFVKSALYRTLIALFASLNKIK